MKYLAYNILLNKTIRHNRDSNLLKFVQATVDQNNYLIKVSLQKNYDLKIILNSFLSKSNLKY